GVGAMHGTAVGAGLETAMACHYRVAVASAQVGQPEVKLGLIPGAGGTQRLPRLAGLVRAAEMCANGEPVRAADALQAGILDRVVEGDLLPGALAFAREVVARGEAPRKARDVPVLPPPVGALEAVRDAIRKRGRGLFAPLKAVEAVEAVRLPFDDGLKKEAELFQECLFSDQSKALIHVFFSERG